METFNLSIEAIILRATSLLGRFKQLPEFAEAKGIELSKERKMTHLGGYLGLYDCKHQISHFLQIGGILVVGDDEYGFKEFKYLVYAKKKIFALVDEYCALVSSETAFKVPGGLRIDAKRIISFSGRTPHEDEALVILLAYQCSWIDYQEFKNFAESTKNPYLEGVICDFLLAA